MISSGSTVSWYVMRPSPRASGTMGGSGPGRGRDAWSCARAHEMAWRASVAEVGYANDLSLLLDKRTDLNTMRILTEAAEVRFAMQGASYRALKTMAQDLGVTINTCVQYAWHKLIHTYTGDEQTIVGTILSGRHLPIAGIENSVGLYINTLPLVMNWRDESIQVQLMQLNERLQKLNEYHFVPLAELQKDGQRLFHSVAHLLETFDAG